MGQKGFSMKEEEKSKLTKSNLAERLTTYIFYASVFIFLVAFNFQDSMTGGWYQQNMPNPLGGQLRDFQFVDSLLGFAVSDSSILKTTNGGDNWSVKFTGYYIFQKIKFLNSNTGYACAGYNNIFKSTNSGENWIALGLPPDLYPSDMFVQSIDSIWLADNNTLVGGLFRTTNGGLNWEKLDYGIIGSYPNKIYFYNSRIGFASNGSLLFRTTNSGYNWSQVSNNNGFNDMVFIDSLTGYKNYDSTRKTTDGGINWIAQKRPNLNIDRSFYKFGVINKDTIWGVGGAIYTSSLIRGIVYITTNGGINWGYQIPDLNINITSSYYLLSLTNKNNIWTYAHSPKGIHTKIGGNDTTFFTNIKEQTTNISYYYELGQNFPNPFNPVTKIKYSIKNSVSGIQYSEVKLIIYNIAGKEVTTLVNNRQTKGDYEVRFDGSNLSSGIYFYTLFVDGNRIDTKKMIFLK